MKRIFTITVLSLVLTGCDPAFHVKLNAAYGYSEGGENELCNIIVDSIYSVMPEATVRTITESDQTIIEIIHPDKYNYANIIIRKWRSEHEIIVAGLTDTPELKRIRQLIEKQINKKQGLIPK